jgi:hypothetical protein
LSKTTAARGQAPQLIRRAAFALLELNDRNRRNT